MNLNLKSIQFKISKNFEFFFVLLLILISIIITQYYNSSKNIAHKEYIKIFNNIYFQKTVKNIFDNFSPKYLKIDHIVVPKESMSSILKKYDVICDGTDNFDTRLLINDYCKKNKKILISAAISKFGGHLFKFNFKKRTPCFRCFMPQKPFQEVNCDVEGIFPPVAGILGSLQANEVLKTILDLKDDLNGNILIFDSLKMNIRKSKITINPNCKNICKN